MQKKFEFIPMKNMGMIFGTLVHETLEDINRMTFNREDISYEKIEEIFAENYRNMQKKYKMNIEKEILITGIESIADYYNNYSEIYNNIKDIEIKLSLVKEKYILEGIIDLVTEREGILEIVDFKTGKRRGNEKVYINQLEIYAYLLKERYGREIRKGKLFYLGEEKENRITEIEFTEKRLKEAVRNFDETAEKILLEDFTCNFDESNEPCSSCCFREYCRAEIGNH